MISLVHRFPLYAVFFVIALAACTPGLDPPPPVEAEYLAEAGLVLETATPFQPTIATPTPDVLTLWISPALPASLQQQLAGLDQVQGRRIQRVDAAEAAQVRAEPSPEYALSEWIFVLTAPFPTIQDDFSFDQLKQTWEGAGGVGVGIYLTEATAQSLVPVLGSGIGLRTAAESELLNLAWGDQTSFAVVPFENLEPRWKVISIDGASPLEKGFEPAIYPLTVQFGLSGDPGAVEAIQSSIDWPMSNRDPGKMSVVVVTGVTALTRATAFMMEARGVLSPAQDIGPWLQDADILHVSNEVSFSPTCPPKPDPSPSNTRFCSLPDHFELFEHIGVDVVELTGNHVMDWGREAFEYSIELYDQNGLPYYGGGLNTVDAAQPALFEHNGNKFAFVGCNAAGPSYAWAGESSPGSSPCNNDQLHNDIRRLRLEGYLPIFTYQWAESYSSTPLPPQTEAFHAKIDAGAVAVSGSQAHQPQAFEFYNGGFIHYGPGNLFFDQMWSTPTRQEFVDRYVFYDGRHISTQLLTALLEDWSRPRPMTAEERAGLLQTIFDASGW